MGRANRSALTGLARRALRGITAEITELDRVVAGLYTHRATFTSPRGRVLATHYYRGEEEAQSAVHTWTHVLGAAIEKLTQADDPAATSEEAHG